MPPYTIPTLSATDACRKPANTPHKIPNSPAIGASVVEKSSARSADGFVISHQSLLAVISGVIAPLFAPMGLGDWRVCTALLTGFMAKESVVSTLSVLFGTTQSLRDILTPLSAVSLLVFCLLYTPCVAAISSVRRELGGKWACFVVVAQCVIAWIVAYAVYLLLGMVM